MRPAARKEATISKSVSNLAGITRNRDNRVIAGVAAGLAERLGRDPLLIRGAFVLLALAGGTGLVLYVAGWLLLAPKKGAESIGQRALRERRGLVGATAVGVAVLAVLIVLRSLGLWWGGGLVSPLALAAAGLTLIWLQGDEDERDLLSGLAARLWPDVPGRRRISRLRVAIGAILVGAGVASFLAANHALRGLRDGLVPLLGLLVGLALIFLPWWRRLARELTEERRERVRSQERAEMAAHLHDSVLQTLALIQRRAYDPRAVVSLARSQERELRAWLNERRGGDSVVGTTFAGAVRQTAADVEVHHEVPVEAVTVGDCELDDRLGALVAAAKEAMVNAAKWSGASAVSVYGEVETGAVTVFVRDRGRGFDPAAIEAGRRGIAESIHGRMSRHGGSAKIRSWPGQGTEVELSMVTARV
jgi:signal transduction histidine kinase/phage shock protein PspC (stress-responsive transcriptional regulator)